MDDSDDGTDFEPADAAGGRAVLVCARADSEARERACTDLLDPVEAPAVDVLVVTFSGAPSLPLDVLRERGVELSRTAGATVGPGDPGLDDLEQSYSVDSLENVDQLSDLGMYVRDVLQDWAGDGTPSVLCFDSVDDLLARADLELTFEFLLVLIEAIRPWQPTAHFYFDPTGYDGATRRTIEQLFDDVVDLTDED